MPWISLRNIQQFIKETLQECNFAILIRFFCTWFDNLYRRGKNNFDRVQGVKEKPISGRKCQKSLAEGGFSEYLPIGFEFHWCPFDQKIGLLWLKARERREQDGAIYHPYYNLINHRQWRNAHYCECPNLSQKRGMTVLIFTAFCFRTSKIVSLSRDWHISTR